MFKHTKNSLSIFLVLSSLTFSSCAAIKENLGIDPPEVSGAGMGAATGAAVGATAGAIIGSTSGNAGEGLLLGGGVGAVSGAVIGSELGERDQEYATHQRTLDNQERQIQNQNRELDRVRGSSFDTSGRFVIPNHNRASRSGVNSYRSSVVASGNSFTGSSSVTRTQGSDFQSNERVANQLRARLTPSSSVIAPPQTKTVLAKGGTAFSTRPSNMPSAAKAVNKADMDLPTAAVEDLPTETVATNTLPKSAEKIAKKEVNSIKNKSVKTEEPKNNKVEAPKAEAKTEVAKQVTETSNAGSCSEAEGEASRARSAASDTDKIFYYRRALRLCKSKPEYHVEMGKVYSSIGRKEEAEFEFSKALEIDPNNRDAQDELTVLMLDSAN